MRSQLSAPPKRAKPALRTCGIADQHFCPAALLFRRIRILTLVEWGGVAESMVPDPVAFGGRPLGDDAAAWHTELAPHDEEARADIAALQYVKDAGSDVRLRAVIEAQGDNRHDTPQRCLKTVAQLISGSFLGGAGASSSRIRSSKICRESSMRIGWMQT